MALKESHGTFYITDVEVTKANTAGGKNGFPKWTKAGWLKKQKKKLSGEKSADKH